MLSHQSPVRPSLQKVSCNETYLSIVKALTDENSLLCISFAIYESSLFRKFVVPLQSSTPMIHNLYVMCNDLISSIFQAFLKDNVYLRTVGGKREIKLHRKLAEVEFEHSDNHKVSLQIFLLYIFFISIRYFWIGANDA